MKLTKQIIKSLTWPTGATHLRVDCPGGKHAVADRKSAAVSFDGIEGELTFGAEVKDGKSRKFVPLANGKVNMVPHEIAEVVATKSAKAAKAAQKPVPASAGDTPRDPNELAKDADERKASAASVKPEPKEKKVREPKTDGPVAFIRAEFIAGKLTARQVADAVVAKFGGDLAKRLVMVRSITYAFKQAGIAGGFRHMTKEEKGASRGSSPTSKAAKLTAAAALAAVWSKAGGKSNGDVIAALNKLVEAHAV